MEMETLRPQMFEGTAPDWVLEATGVTKSFGGVKVLHGVDLRLRAGEVHALMGENGAGKSTLMKILAGIHRPDAGEVRVTGRLVPPGNPHASLKAGVAMIFQELSPFPDLSVAENILMGLQPAWFGGGWIRRRKMHRRAKELLACLNTPIPTRRRLGELRVAEMQVVEIAKALAHQARVIVMDEPTSALSELEAQALYQIVGDLRRQGVAVVYISHKLDEVFRLADRMSVLRDGAMAATGLRSEFTPEQLIRWMVGRDVSLEAAPRTAVTGPPVLSVQGFSKRNVYADVSFEVAAGEVLGLAGLMGAGRTEVVNGLYGLDPADAGEVQVRGRTVRIRGPRDALRAGIGLVSEDRKLYGLVPTLGVPPNLTLAGLERCCRRGWVSRSAERQVANEAVCALGIRARQLQQPVDRLSGGNQQKVVLGRTLFTEPEVLLLDEPTRGIDVGARAEIHGLIRRLTREGKAVVMVSSEMPELLALSDRLVVLRQGRVAGRLTAAEASPEAVLKLAMPE